MPRKRQAGFNASSRDQWEGFAGHRREVSALLGAGSVPRPTRLCVLGAGNANDLDLPSLLGTHREVHLLDLDAEALALGAVRQGVADDPGLHLHGGLDVTGMLDALAAWTPLTPIGPAVLEALSMWPAERAGRALPGPFDVVASTCLLSQLVNTAFHAIGDAHPQFPAVVRAIRVGHLRLLDRLAAPGGKAILITDVASSDHAPELIHAPDSMLPSLLTKLVREGKAIRGVSPGEVVSALRGGAILSAPRTRVQPATPWRWRLHGRDYLVWAIRWRQPSRPGMA